MPISNPLSKAIVFAAATLVTCLFVTPSGAQNSPSMAAIIEAWLGSPHGDRAAEAYTHWDTEGAVPERCATCHSGAGFMDFTGADGTAAGVVDHPAPTGWPVDCVACHSPAASALASVTFPSGVTVSGLGSSTVCAVCHQGRTSGDTVNASIADRAPDTAAPDLGFVNVHYRAAAATMIGGAGRGGYQYEGKTYAERFVHVPGLDTCASCHNPHDLKVEIASCTSCHKGADALEAIRTTPADHDGDGDVTEGIAAEIATLHGRLIDAIRAYARQGEGTDIAYSAATHPYFFIDTNGDGAADDTEAVAANRYGSWTPRLLKAAYNYQFIAKDPGAYAHNPRYAAQLLIDSLQDLSEKVPVDLSGITRP